MAVVLSAKAFFHTVLRPSCSTRQLPSLGLWAYWTISSIPRGVLRLKILAAVLPTRGFSSLRTWYIVGGGRVALALLTKYSQFPIPNSKPPIISIVLTLPPFSLCAFPCLWLINAVSQPTTMPSSITPIICLAAAVAVAAHQNPPNVLSKDVVIIGGGASGAYAAVRLQDDYGKSIALVEIRDSLVSTFVESVLSTPQLA